MLNFDEYSLLFGESLSVLGMKLVVLKHFGGQRVFLMDIHISKDTIAWFSLL